MSTATALHTADPATRERLSGLLLALTGRNVAEVRITRTRWDDGLHWVAMALAAEPRAPKRRREIPLTEGAHHRQIALALRDAFPHADWSVAQDYDVAAGVLAEHHVRRPAELRGGAR